MKKIFNICLICLISIFAFSGVFVLLKNVNNKDGNSSNQIDWSNIEISCLGDSLTFGSEINTSYPKLLKKKLGAKMVYNYGIGYSTCSVITECECHPTRPKAHYPMCERYTQIKESSDIIIVMCGFNDAGLAPLGTIDDTENTTFYGAMNTMCKGLKEKYSNSWIFFMTSFKYDHYGVENPTNDFGYHREDYYNTAVKKICNKYDFDVFDTFSELSWHSVTNAVDNVHPNQEFVTNTWVPAIANYIKENYKQK